MTISKEEFQEQYGNWSTEDRDRAFADAKGINEDGGVDGERVAVIGADGSYGLVLEADARKAEAEQKEKGQQFSQLKNEGARGIAACSLLTEFIDHPLLPFTCRLGCTERFANEFEAAQHISMAHMEVVHMIVGFVDRLVALGDKVQDFQNQMTQNIEVVEKPKRKKRNGK